MKLKIYAIKDNGAETFGNLYCMINNGSAIRSFADELNRQSDDNFMGRHPTHFDLYEVGEFNTDTGAITAKALNLLIRGSDAKARPDSTN